MNKEEKEQWLYEEYQYTKNFDFSRLEKYEEANDDICIDDIILDYTMLYEFHKEEIERLNNIINELKIILRQKGIEITIYDQPNYEKISGYVSITMTPEQLKKELKGSDKE